MRFRPRATKARWRREREMAFWRACFWMVAVSRGEWVRRAFRKDMADWTRGVGGRGRERRVVGVK